MGISARNINIVKKYILVVLILLSCQKEDEMLQFLIQSQVENIEQIKAVYRFGLIGDSIAAGRTSQLDGQPTELYDGVLSTVLTDNCENWNGSALRAHQLNMNIQGDNNGGWGIEHRFAYEMINNNKALKVESIKYANGSTGLSANDFWAIGDVGLTAFLAELTQWGATLDNLFIVLPINDATSDARVTEVATLWQPFLQQFVDNPNILKISVFEMVEATSVTPARLASVKQIVLDGISAIGSSKIVFIDNNPLWTFIDNVHPDVDSTDEMAMFAYNNR